MGRGSQLLAFPGIKPKAFERLQSSHKLVQHTLATVQVSYFVRSMVLSFRVLCSKFLCCAAFGNVWRVIKTKVW